MLSGLMCATPTDMCKPTTLSVCVDLLEESPRPRTTTRVPGLPTRDSFAQLSGRGGRGGGGGGGGGLERWGRSTSDTPRYTFPPLGWQSRAAIPSVASPLITRWTEEHSMDRGGFAMCPYHTLAFSSCPVLAEHLTTSNCGSGIREIAFQTRPEGNIGLS